jgi:hypothetical protein
MMTVGVVVGDTADWLDAEEGEVPEEVVTCDDEGECGNDGAVLVAVIKETVVVVS